MLHNQLLFFNSLRSSLYSTLTYEPARNESDSFLASRFAHCRFLVANTVLTSRKQPPFAAHFARCLFRSSQGSGRGF